MQNFDYQTPTRLIFGKGVIEELPEVMEQFGKRILLSYGSGSIKKIGLYDKVKELLKGFEIYELPDIQPNPKYNYLFTWTASARKKNRQEISGAPFWIAMI